jgi:hypothetical protein
MNYIEFYNFLDGKNLCNLFANLIVKKFTELSPDVKTNITVINVRNFFIVKGTTTYNETINLAEIFQDYLKTYDSNLSEKIRVIDSILYNDLIEESPINIHNVFVKSQDKKINELQKLINPYTIEKIYFNLKLQETTKHLYYDCNINQLSTVINILKEHFSEYTLIKSDFTQETYTSDPIYGMSNRYYYSLLLSIKTHLFNLGISKSLDISLYTDMKIEDMDNLNVNFVLNNNNHIVKTEWLESLVLDVFPFTSYELTKTFNDITDLEDYIKDSSHGYSFNKLTFSKDIILI